MKRYVWVAAVLAFGCGDVSEPLEPDGVDAAMPEPEREPEDPDAAMPEPEDPDAAMPEPEDPDAAMPEPEPEPEPDFEENFDYTTEEWRADIHDYYLEQWNLDEQEIVDGAVEYQYPPDVKRDYRISNRIDVRKPGVLGREVTEVWAETLASFDPRFHTTQINKGWAYVDDVTGTFEPGETLTIGTGTEVLYRAFPDALGFSMSGNHARGSVVTGQTSGATAVIASDPEWEVGGASLKFLHVNVFGAAGRFAIDQGVHGHRLDVYGPNDSKEWAGHDRMSLELWDGEQHSYRQHVRLPDAAGEGGLYRVWIDEELIYDREIPTAADSLWGLTLVANKNLPQKEVVTLRFHRVRLWATDPGW